MRVVLLFLLTVASFAQTTKPPIPGPRDVTGPIPAQASLATVSIEQFRSRLGNADALVAACQRAIQADHCRSEEVGADVQLNLPSGTRVVRFDWLRLLLDEAAHYDPARQAEAEKKEIAPRPLSGPGSQAPTPPTKASPATGPPPAQKLPIVAPPVAIETADAMEPLPKRLERARERLRQDAEWLDRAVAAKPASSAASRQAISAILAAKEYRSATIGRTLKDRILERVARWLNKAINKLVDVGSKSRWIGVTAEVVFVIALCVGLVWFLMRLEKQGRFGAAYLNDAARTGAPSERDWQLWLKDARAAAADGAWREAIHFMYWASISRMESSGLWSADRARTPREYLALLADDSAQRSELKARLTALTRSFERTWYGGRSAAKADFEKVEQLAAALGARPDGSSDWKGER